jgi:hypothetical protein
LQTLQDYIFQANKLYNISQPNFSCGVWFPSLYLLFRHPSATFGQQFCVVVTSNILHIYISFSRKTYWNIFTVQGIKTAGVTS